MIRPIEDGFYEIISGERRYSALKSLVDKGDNKYSKVPCKIVNLNDVDSEITLIQANAQTRELSDADKLKQIERLTELYKEKKKNGEKVTNIRKLVSKDIGLSEGQVAKYSTVSNNLIPELRTILDEGNLSISNATEFSSLSEENQKIILDIINKRVDIMFDKGLVNEVKNLLNMGYTKDLVSMNGIGYKEVVDYINGKYSLDETKEIIKRETRHFAKRQLTWFRREKDVTMVNYFDYDSIDDTLKYMINTLREKDIIKND